MESITCLYSTYLLPLSAHEVSLPPRKLLSQVYTHFFFSIVYKCFFPNKVISQRIVVLEFRSSFHIDSAKASFGIYSTINRCIIYTISISVVEVPSRLPINASRYFSDSSFPLNFVILVLLQCTPKRLCFILYFYLHIQSYSFVKLAPYLC